MPVLDTSIYRSRDDILSDMISQLIAAIPDAYTGEDGVTRIIFEIESGQYENLYLATQLLLEDMFVTTASYQALIRHGEQYGLPMSGHGFPQARFSFRAREGRTFRLVPRWPTVRQRARSSLFHNHQDGTVPNIGTPTHRPSSMTTRE